jgi:hypothetical protein
MEGVRPYDVVVVGGGVAGVAAALECGRSALRTALVEKTLLFGGLATGGMVPLFMCLCDGEGRQVTAGIAEELLAASIRYGPGRIPEPWSTHIAGAPRWDPLYACDSMYPKAGLDRRYMSIFVPAAFALALDEVLEGTGAELWLDSLACTPIVQGNRVRGVEVENKSGRIALEAGCLIDATGDADIAFRAGAPCEELGTYPTYLYQYTSLELASKAVERGNPGRLVGWRGIGGSELDDGSAALGRRYRATRGSEVSELALLCRKVARRKLRESASALDGETVQGREKLYPTALPSLLQCRRSRRILGEETVEPGARGAHVQSSVGMIADCRTVGDVWEVPYGALLPRQVDGLLVAGRCASARGYAWHVSRLIQAVALTGQAAGAAAALAVRQGTHPRALEPRAVQAALQERGIPLHIPGS